jgi:DNA-directed RNA polymerase specialized sigma24 family protein
MKRTETPTSQRREVLRADFDQVPEQGGFWFDTQNECDDVLRVAVREAVEQQLTARQREIVEWHFFEGLSQGAIAHRLGVTQQVVQKTIYGVQRNGRPVGGALRKLREVLTPLLASSSS